jgi:hypothetical protein
VTLPSGNHLDALLAVQEIDTALDRGRHRLMSLPELAQLAVIDTEVAALDQQLARAREERDAVAGVQQTLEANLGTVESRAAELKKRLYGGTVSATRELQAMAAEVDSLTARASELESRVLETMEAREPLDARVAGIEGEKSSRLEVRAVLEEKRAVRQAEVTAELDALHEARAAAAADVPADLLAIYDNLRQHLGGVGAARLVGSRCGGCHLTLPATELDQLRHQPPGTLNYCEQCGRILVPSPS